MAKQNRFDKLTLLNIKKYLLNYLNKENMLDEFAKKPSKLKI